MQLGLFDDVSRAPYTYYWCGGFAPKELTPYDPNPFKVIEKNVSMITASRNEQNMTRKSSNFKRIIFDLLAWLYELTWEEWTCEFTLKLIFEWAGKSQ